MRFTSLLLLFVAILAFSSKAEATVIVNPVLQTEKDASEEEIKAAAADYKASLKDMTAKERRQLRRSQKKQVKQLLKDHKDGKSDVDDEQLLLIILAIFVPPLAVYLYEGDITTKFWISLVLTLLFFLPGIIYSLLVVTETI